MSITEILQYEKPNKNNKKRFETPEDNNAVVRPFKRQRREEKKNNNDENKHENVSFEKRKEINETERKAKFQAIINKPKNKKQTFQGLGVCRELCLSIKKQKWIRPTAIQVETIPHALCGNDIIALAETGSGKTAAYAIPILQSLLDRPVCYYGLILAPTRELALQIQEQFDNLGKDVGLKSITIIGGVDRTLQALKLQKRPHVVIGTPGRILDHLINCKGFRLFNLKFLILDEADRILQSEFANAIEEIIKIIQKHKKDYEMKKMLFSKQKEENKNNDNHLTINEDNIECHNYQTLLFSATMTKKVERLEKACLKEPIVKLQINKKYKTVETLTQNYLFIPAKHKLCYVVYLLNSEFNDRSIIVFTNTKRSCHHLSLVLHNLSFTVIPLHGEMTQHERLGAIEKFKQGTKSILIATDVAARGLDIPLVSVIINYDLPIHCKDYIHRVGRTARAGKKGLAINMVTQYDVEMFQRIEQLINIQITKYNNDSINEDKVMLLMERVMQADRLAITQMKEHYDEIKDKIKEFSNTKNKNNNNDNDNDNDNDEIRSKPKKFQKRQNTSKFRKFSRTGDQHKDYKKSFQM